MRSKTLREISDDTVVNLMVGYSELMNSVNSFSLVVPCVQRARNYDFSKCDVRILFKTFKGFTLGTCYSCLHRLAQWLISRNLLRFFPFKGPLIGYCFLPHCCDYSRTFG